MTKLKPHFSRKLLAIPYGLFLALFVVLPLLIIVYYAFFNDKGVPDWEYVKIFFTEDFASKLKTIGISLFISFAPDTVIILSFFRKYPTATIATIGITAFVVKSKSSSIKSYSRRVNSQKCNRRNFTYKTITTL